MFDVSPAQNVLFSAWYTFAPNASPSAGPAGQRWFTLQASLGANLGALNGIGIYEASGGVFNQGGGVQTTQVGTATLSFRSCTAATLTYQFTSGENSGHAGAIDLTRLVAPLPGCSF